jgi:hypothetical protein
MRHPLISLIVALVLFVLGACLMAPVTASKKTVTIGPNGPVTRMKTDAEYQAAKWHVFRINLPGYICFGAAAVSFGWTVFLVSYGVITVVRDKLRHVKSDHFT